MFIIISVVTKNLRRSVLSLIVKHRSPLFRSSVSRILQCY